MSGQDGVYAKLKALRDNKTFQLKPSKFLRSTFKGFDGEERPLKLRYYQNQGVAHFIGMKRFLLGDDCGLGKCVAPDTVVQTDHGPRQIGTLAQGAYPEVDQFGPALACKVWTGVHWAPVKRFYNGGERDTIIIKAANGKLLEGSHNHPIMTDRGWVKLPDLSVGDRVCYTEPGWEGIEFTEIVEVSKGHRLVVDLEMDDPSHCFEGNGFINHNTIQSIAGMCYVWDKNPDVKVVIVTNKSAVEQWCLEFDKFCVGGKVKVLQCAGTPKKREKIYEEFFSSKGPTALVLGYGSLRRDYAKFKDCEGITYVMDEMTAVKNPKSQIHKICKYLSAKTAERVWGLSATMIKNNLTEGYGIFEVLLAGTDTRLFPETLNSFLEDYYVMRMQSIGRGRKVPVPCYPKKGAVARFRQAIEPYFIGRAKHEVASDLPPLTTRVEKVEMTKAQRIKYAEALDGLLEVDTTGEEREMSELTAIIYCQQIANHPSLVGCEGDSNKLDRLIELLTEGDLAGENVIVYSRFAKMVDLIMKALKKAKVPATRITGKDTKQVKYKGQKIGARSAAMQSFNDSEDETRVICITDAASEAINLQSAKAIIFFDSPWSAGNLIQIIGRMIRIGSMHDAVYAIHLACRNSVDEKVLQVLKKKMNLIEAVLGKRIKGAGDKDFDIDSGNDITDLFRMLKEDAKK